MGQHLAACPGHDGGHGEQAKAEPFRFPAAGLVLGQGEFGPGGCVIVRSRWGDDEEFGEDHEEHRYGLTQKD